MENYHLILHTFPNKKEANMESVSIETEKLASVRRALFISVIVTAQTFFMENIWSASVSVTLISVQEINPRTTIYVRSLS